MEIALAKKKMRKCRDVLATAGYGIVILVIWDFIKSIIYLNWSIPTVVEGFNQPYTVAYVVFVLTELAYCTISGLVISRVGRNNKKVSRGVLLLSIFLLVFAITCIAVNLTVVIMSNGFDIMTAIVFIEDIIFLIFAIKILYSVIKLIKLSNFLEEHNDER